MKKFFLISVLLGTLPLVSMAQDDDLYFTPKKSVKSEVSSIDSNPAYYVGSSRDVDEYNRRGKSWSLYQKVGVDAKGNDIIEFKKGNGIYPDSTYIDTTFVGKYYDTVVSQDDIDDYLYTRRMSRWDGFYDPWFYSYRWGYGPYWGYDPFWRYGWNDPYWGWGYPYYAGFYDPWYYGYGYPYRYGWYHSYYYGYPRIGYVSYGGPAGTRNHSRGTIAGTGNHSGVRSFGNARFGGSRSTTGGSFGRRDNVSNTQATVVSRGVKLNDGSVRFGGSRAINRDNNNSTFNSNTSRSINSSNNSSFGSSRSGGGSFGGGSFGGSRSSGGGHSGGGGGGHFGNRR
ncbi:MAG: hypothetical protein II422_06180 [Prevotella sp.]|jgi:hypothetical protein|nr:hypothetical protein [Prevotella sp.]